MKNSIKLFLFTCIVLVCAITTSYADNTIDSLKKEITTYEDEDTTKVQLILAVARIYSEVKNGEATKEYAQKALILSKKLNHQNSQCLSLLNMGLAHYHLTNYDSSIVYYNQALEFCKSKNLKLDRATVFTNIGNVYLQLSDFTTALDYYDSVITIAQEIENKGLEASITNNIATIYYEQGLYTPALKNYMYSLRLHEGLKNDKFSLENLNNITNVYFRLDEYDKAKEYANKSLSLAKKIGSTWGIISSHTTYAMIFNKMEQYDSALVYMHKAYNLSKTLNNEYLVNIMKGNLAECHMNLGNLDTAYKLYSQSVQVSTKLNDIQGIAVAKAGVGQVLMKKGNKMAGAKHVKEALSMMMKAGMKEQSLEMATILSDACEKSGDLGGAVKYLRIKELYRDSIAKEKSLQETKIIESEYLLQKKEAQIALLQKDRAIELNILKQQRILNIAAIIGMTLAAIIAILIFRNLRDARKHNALIIKQKEEIELQAQKLEELNAFKDTTFSVLSHDLRSPINALTGTMALLDEGVITPEEFTQHKGELNNKLQSVSLLLDNLLQWAKSQMKGEYILEQDDIDLHQKVQSTLNVVKDAAVQKQISLNNHVDEAMSLYADPNQIEMVLRNLVSNAVKFTPKGGKVDISAERQNGHISINVQDNGLGMTTEQVKSLLDGNIHVSTLGTSGEKGTGIGLQLSYAFVKSNGGDIKIESEPGKGSKFTVILPVQQS